MKLKDCKVAYELENALHIEFRYKEENFPHLLGLHKLTDLQLIQFMNNKSNMIITPKTVVNRIRRSLFTEKDIKASSFFYKIRDRYESFSYNSLSTLHYTDAVICFNASLAHSLLKKRFCFV